MITLPASDEPLRLLAIDPGTSTLGVALLSWDFGPNFVVEHAFTAKVKDEDDTFTEMNGNRLGRMRCLINVVDEELNSFEPHVIIAESPFLGRFPQAFAALVELLTLLRLSVNRYNSQLPLYTIDPKTVKKAVGVDLGKKNDKDDVTQALRIHPDLAWNVDIETLDEHSIDAVAVGLYYLLNLV